MNSKKVGSSSSSVTNTPQYHPPGGGDPENRVSTSSAKPWSINDFDFSGEPQELSDATNLSTFCERQDASQAKSAPSQLQFDSESSVDDGSRDADSAREEFDPVTLPANTPPGPAQPTVQLSDDPAIAALQKSQLAIAAAVVLYSTCLAIFENAIADPQSKLPPNSFSYLRSMFSGAIKESEACALDLKTEFTQLLTQHSEEAKALAAQAERGTSPVSVDTFSTKPGPVVTPVDWKQVRQEVKQLPTQAQQDQVVKGLRVALKQMDPVSGADVDRELRQLLWDMDPMEGVDSEIRELYEQLQVEETNPTPLNTRGPDTTLPTQALFDELDELLQNTIPASCASTRSGSMLTQTASQQPADLDAEQNALLADIEKMLPPADSKSSTAPSRHRKFHTAQTT